MKTLYVIGPRGINNTIGGIEIHCKEIYGRLNNFSKSNLKIVICLIDNKAHKDLAFNGCELKYFKTVKAPGIEKFIYSLKSIFSAIINKADIVHFQGLNGVYTLPIAKIFGLKTVVTIHSRDYTYPKWSYLQKKFIKFAEYLSHLADEKITVSKSDYKNFTKQTINLHYIANGVSMKNDTFNFYNNRFSLQSNNYIFTAARFTEEKSLLELIDAFSKITNDKIQLVIAGDGTSKYAQKFIERASETKRVILVGSIFGDELLSLYRNASLFLLTSCKEQTIPLSLLEAMSVKTDILTSNLPQILPLHLPSFNIFEINNIDELSKKIDNLLVNPSSNEEIDRRYLYLKNNHNWDEAVKKIYGIYNGL